MRRFCKSLLLASPEPRQKGEGKARTNFYYLFTPADCLTAFVAFVAIPKIDVTETTNKELNNFPGAQIAMDGRTRLSLLHTLHRRIDEVEGKEDREGGS